MYGTKFLFTSIATACLLAACGGGGGGGSSNTGGNPAGNPTAENPGGTPATPGANEDVFGVWEGRTSMARSGRPNLNWDATAVALRDGRVYLVSSEYYSIDTADERNKYGALVVGNATASNGSYSFNGQEFGFETDWLTRPATVSTTYAAQSTMSGTVSYNDGSSRTLTANYSTAYDTAADLGQLDSVFNNAGARSIQGTFFVSNPSGGHTKHPVSLIVGTDGAISSRFENECNVTGSLRPNSEKRIFEATITFNSNNCPYPANTTLEGVAFTKATKSTVSNPTVVENRFHLAASNAAQTQGVVFAQILGQETPQ